MLNLFPKIISLKSWESKLLNLGLLIYWKYNQL